MDLFGWISNQRDRALALGVGLVGLVALVIGWYGLAGEALPAAQLPYLASGGLLGIFALGVGATMWLSADLRDEWTKLEDLDQKLDKIVAQPDEQARAVTPDVQTNGTGTPRRPIRSTR